VTARDAPPRPAAPAGLAALRLAQPVARIGGGYETDVFISGDRRYALKLKRGISGAAAALAQARLHRAAAERFRDYLGEDHAPPSYYLVVAGARGTRRVLGVQPFLNGARGLDTIDLAALGPDARAALAAQLADVVARSRACFAATGTLPDLYGTSSQDSAHARAWNLGWALRALWHLVAGRPLLGSYNLLLTPDWRVVLVDKDPLCPGGPLCRLVYAARAALLGRDRRQIAALARGRRVW
jgi:hypothetical protein